MKSLNIYPTVSGCFCSTVMTLRFIHIVCLQFIDFPFFFFSSFIFIVARYSIVYQCLFLCCLVDKHFCCFWFLAITNSANRNIIQQFWCIQACVFVEYILGVESLGYRLHFSSVRYCQAISVYTPTSSV